jgi:hypothetical protein
MWMLEFSTENKATAFLQEHQKNKLELGGQAVQLAKYSNRLLKWEKQKPKSGTFLLA